MIHPPCRALERPIDYALAQGEFHDDRTRFATADPVAPLPALPPIENEPLPPIPPRAIIWWLDWAGRRDGSRIVFQNKEAALSFLEHRDRCHKESGLIAPTAYEIEEV